MVQPAVPPPSCPRCGARAVYHAQAGGWGCDSCRQMLPPPPPQAQDAPAAPACPTCGTPAVWHAQAGRWGCDRCRAFLDTMAPAQPPPPAQLAPDQVKAARRIIGMKMIVLGLILALIGIIVTAATHEAALGRGGGRYIIAYGPIVVGTIRFFQGLYYLA
jgi:ribosomal protein L37AE/L43A